MKKQINRVGVIAIQTSNNADFLFYYFALWNKRSKSPFQIVVLVEEEYEGRVTIPAVRFDFFSALCSLIGAKKYPVGFPTRHVMLADRQNAF